MAGETPMTDRIDHFAEARKRIDWALDALLGTVTIDPDEERVVLDPDIAAALGIETGAGDD